MGYTDLSDSIMAGDGGHITIHNQIADNFEYLRDAPGWTNVKAAAYGAAGDNSTDDTTAINNAISAANSAGGGVVYFPAGTYKISTALTLFSDIIILGDGPDVSVIHQTGTTVNGLQWTGNQIQDVLIRDIGITGPSSGSGVGLSIAPSGGSNPNAANVSLDNVVFTGFGSHAISGNLWIVSTFTNVRALNPGGALIHLSGVANTSLTFTSCYANGPSGHGFDFASGLTYSVLNGCACDSVAGSNIGYNLVGAVGVTLNSCGNESSANAFVVNGGSSVTLNACKTYANTGTSFKVTGGAANVTLIGCQEQGPGAATHSFEFDSGTNVNVIGWQYTTSTLLTALPNMLNDGSGNASVNGLSTLLGGSNTSSIAGNDIQYPMTITTGTAMQPSTATDVMVYLAVNTTSTVAITIGGTSTPNVFILASGSITAPNMFSFRVPRGWYLKSTFTSADVTWYAVPC